MISPVVVLVAAGAAVAAVALSSKKKSSGGARAPAGCKLSTELLILQANQAALSKDQGLINATATIFDQYGCHAEAVELRKYAGGYAQPLAPRRGAAPPPLPYRFKSGAPIPLEHGAVYRASAVLGPLGCAVGMGTIQDKLSERGFQVLRLEKNNPFDPSWEPPSGFLECARYAEVRYMGPPKTDNAPSQVWRLERIA